MPHPAPLEPIVQCQRHRGAWYPKSKGCSLCRAHELALKSGDELVARCAREAAAARAETASLDAFVADLNALRALERRAIDGAKATLARLDLVLA